MRISELIGQLQVHLNLEGDIEVAMYAQYEGLPYHIDYAGIQVITGEKKAVRAVTLYDTGFMLV